MTAPSQSEIASYIAAAGEAAWQVPGLDGSVARRPIAKVGIIGAGTMGGGISMNFATAGFDVTIVETQQEALDRGLKIVRGNYQRSADRGRFPQDEVDLRMAHQMVYSLSVEGTRTTNDAMDFIPFFEQKFSEKGAVLTRDPRDECFLHKRCDKKFSVL